MADTYASLTIINVDGTEYSIPHVYRATSVRNFKRVVGMKMKCSAAATAALHLLVLGEELDDARTLDSYDLDDGDIIRVIPGAAAALPPPQTTALPAGNNDNTNQSGTQPTSTRPENRIGSAFVKDDHKTYVLDDLTMDMTADDVLELISAKVNVDTQYLMVIYGGKQLKEGTGITLRDYGVTKDSTLHIVTRVRGGGHRD